MLRPYEGTRFKALPFLLARAQAAFASSRIRWDCVEDKSLIKPPKFGCEGGRPFRAFISRYVCSQELP